MTTTHCSWSQNETSAPPCQTMGYSGTRKLRPANQRLSVLGYVSAKLQPLQPLAWYPLSDGSHDWIRQAMMYEVMLHAWNQRPLVCHRHKEKKAILDVGLLGFAAQAISYVSITIQVPIMSSKWNFCIPYVLSIHHKPSSR